jgi:hypothetical protein
MGKKFYNIGPRWKSYFGQLGLNEADTLKSSSILIDSTSEQIIIHKMYGMTPRLLKGGN